MLVIPAVAVFLTFVYLRPHELFPVMRMLTVNVVAGLMMFSLILDLKVGRGHRRASALLFGMVGLFAWYMFTVAIKAPERIGPQLGLFGISLVGFLGIAYGFQTFRGLGVVAGLLLGFTLLVAGFGIYQGMRSPVCFALLADTNEMGATVDVSDGRSCAKRSECDEGGLPNREYVCERPGVFGTHSVGGRVRFRGLLEDPNELAWAIAMGTPLAFAFFERRRTARRMALLMATLIVGFACVIMSQSRSGQLSMVAMLGVYFVRRFRWRGAIAAVLVALPLLILGGRSGEEAESSSLERLECWNEALAMWRENPFMGVGGGQFLEHHYLTAHSSFMLTFAELGPVGLVLLSAVLYFAFKILIRIQIDLAHRQEAAAARTWATALLASLVGLLVSAFFLSIPFHAILWTFLALPGVLYAAVREHDPDFEVRFGWRDLSLVVGVDIVLVAGTAIYLKLKGV